MPGEPRHEGEYGQKKTDVSLYHHYSPAVERKTARTYRESGIYHSRLGALNAGLLTVGAGLAVGLIAALIGNKD